MIFLKKNNLIKLVILILSLSSLNGGWDNKSIFLPTIPIHFSNDPSDIMNNDISAIYHKTINTAYKAEEPFYTFSLDYIKTKHQNRGFFEYIQTNLAAAGIGAVLGIIAEAQDNGYELSDNIAIGASGAVTLWHFWLMLWIDSGGFWKSATKIQSFYEIKYHEEQIKVDIIEEIGDNWDDAYKYKNDIKDFKESSKCKSKSYYRKYETPNGECVTSKHAVFVPLKLNFNELYKKSSILKTNKDYEDLFLEIRTYNNFIPNFNDIKIWKKLELEKFGNPKGEFEKTNDYKNRVIYEKKMSQKIWDEYRTKKDIILKEFDNKQEETFNVLMEKINQFEGIYRLHKIELSNYNADEETFTVTSPTHFLQKKIGVKLKDAPNFKEKYLNTLVLKQMLKPIISTDSKSLTDWKEGQETILINLKTNKHIPFLSENSIFKYSIEEN